MNDGGAAQPSHSAVRLCLTDQSANPSEAAPLSYAVRGIGSGKAATKESCKRACCSLTFLNLFPFNSVLKDRKFEIASP